MLSTSQTKNERLRIAIIGAGIGGLTLSNALGYLGKDCNFDIDVYEGTASISEIGAGINFWPRSWEIMNNLGLADKLLQFLPRIPDDSPSTVFQIRKSDQQEGFYVRDVRMKGGSVRFHRADLQQTLLSQLSGHLHLSHRLISYEDTGKEVQLYFMDGSMATCDVLIGMDGIKSVVRRGFLQNQGFLKSPSLDPMWTGTVAYRGLVSVDKLEALCQGHRAVNTPMLYSGKFKHLIVYQVSQDRLINVVAFVTDPLKEGADLTGPPTMDCDQDEMLAAFKGWEPEVQALLRCIEKPSKWAIRQLRPLQRWASGRVILAGDAAHAMAPHQGAGAGQAIEDAYILATLLCHKYASRDTAPEIAEMYNTIRCPEGNRVLAESEIAGKRSQLVGPGFDEVKEGDTDVPLENLQILFEDIARRWEWVWKESAEKDRKRALTMLELAEAFHSPAQHGVTLSGRL